MIADENGTGIWVMIAYRMLKLTIALSLFMLSATSVKAVSANDVDAWGSRFKDAVASGDTEQIVNALDEVKDDRLDRDGLHKAVSSFNSSFSLHDLQFTIKIEDQSIEGFYHRFTTAAIYRSQHVYYTTTFVKDANSWHLISIQMNTDINKVLSLPWPQ